MMFIQNCDLININAAPSKTHFSNSMCLLLTHETDLVYAWWWCIYCYFLYTILCVSLLGVTYRNAQSTVKLSNMALNC